MPPSLTSSAPVSYLRTKNFLDLARVIRGAVLYVGNQSGPAAIAQGLRSNMILESVDRHHWAWNCHWERPGFWDTADHLPTLDSLAPWTVAESHSWT